MSVELTFSPFLALGSTYNIKYWPYSHTNRITALSIFSLETNYEDFKVHSAHISLIVNDVTHLKLLIFIFDVELEPTNSSFG